MRGRGSERFVVAPTTGAWRTGAALGQKVGTGEVVGLLAGVALKAPIAGSLRGLTRDGVLVHEGQRLIEVDSSEIPHVFGLGERPLAIASGVCRALDLE